MRLARRLRRERGPEALASGKLAILGELRRSGERTPRQLADGDRVQPQSLSRTLAALERDGFVYRRPDSQDGRRAWIGLTDNGREALRNDMSVRDRWLEAQIGRLTPAERAVLMLAVELIDALAEEEERVESQDAAA
jgi:DNA-binding MarR family transcriptional regulator